MQRQKDIEVSLPISSHESFSLCLVQKLLGHGNFIPTTKDYRWHSGKESTSQCLPTQENPLEEGMATHSGILAWEIPWTEKPGGLQSIGSQKSQTWLSACTHTTPHTHTHTHTHTQIAWQTYGTLRFMVRMPFENWDKLKGKLVVVQRTMSLFLYAFPFFYR